MKPTPTTLAILAIAALAGCGVTTSSTTATPQIVFEAPGIPGGNAIQELYTSNLDGSNRKQITSDGLNEFLPHFSPDGARLLYSKFYTGMYGDPNPQTDIAVYDFATAHETRLTNNGTAFQPAWSPDGSQVAYGAYQGDSLWIMNADGSNAHLLGHPSGNLDDLRWDDFAWSSDNWILFTVAQNTGNCFKVRLDKVRPDGTARTQVTSGGTACTPNGMQQYGDADPGFSADGQTIYSSRGIGPAPGNLTETLRHLYAFSSDAFTPGKIETDLSLPTHPDCIAGVPKRSPDQTRILLFLSCPTDPQHAGVTLTDTAGSDWTYIADGFGADWNPAFTRR